MSMLDFYAGAEELNLEGGAGEVVDAVEEVVKTEVAELAVVIEEQSAAIEDLTEEMGELDDAVEELEETVDGLENLLQSGSYNPLAFSRLYARGVKLANKLGADIDDSTRMGAESVSDAATAELMVRSGIESFMDKAKEYGRKAVEFIKHIFNTVINFFVSLFNQVEGMQRRSAQLKKRLDDGATVKPEVKLGGWNVFFDYAKNGLSDSDKAKGFDKTRSALGSFVELGKNVSGVDLAGFKSAYSSLVAALKADATSVGKAQAKKNGSTNVIIGVSNGMRVRASYNDVDAKDLTEAAAAARSIKLTLGKDPDAKKMTSGSVKAKLDKTALLGKLGDVNKALAAMRQDNIAKKFSAAERDRVIGSLNAVKAGDADKASDVSKQVNLVRAVYAAGATLTQVVGKITSQETRALLDGIAAHLSY